MPEGKLSAIRIPCPDTAGHAPPPTFFTVKLIVTVWPDGPDVGVIVLLSNLSHFPAPIVTHDLLTRTPETVAVAQFSITIPCCAVAVKVNVAVYAPASVAVLVQLRLLEVVAEQFQSEAGLTTKDNGRVNVIPVGCWSPTTTVPGAQVCPAGTVKVMVTSSNPVGVDVTVLLMAKSHFPVRLLPKLTS